MKKKKHPVFTVLKSKKRTRTEQRPKELKARKFKPENDPLLDQLLDVEAQLIEAKRLYSLRDVLLDQLLKKNFKCLVYKGRNFQIVDNFSDRNVAFKTAGVKRFELKIS